MSHGRHDPVQRINDKHGEELLGVARSLGGRPDATSARAARIDPSGIDLEIITPGGPAVVRVDFTEPVSDPRWMRAAFRDLTRKAETALAGDGTES